MNQSGGNALMMVGISQRKMLGSCRLRLQCEPFFLKSEQFAG